MLLDPSNEEHSGMENGMPGANRFILVNSPEYARDTPSVTSAEVPVR
jgi:hypothetical protein